MFLFYTIVFLLGLVVLNCLFMLKRNDDVLKYNLNLLFKIGKLRNKDEYNYYMEKFDKLDYSRMVSMWWLPLKAFHGNKDFFED